MNDVTAMALAIGATRFAACRVAADGSVCGSRQTDVPADAVWEGCRELLLDVAGEDEIAAIGIASAGPIHAANGVVAPLGIHGWQDGFRIVAPVQRMFPVASVCLALDAVCQALAEQSFRTGHSPIVPAEVASVLSEDAVLMGAGLLALAAVDSVRLEVPGRGRRIISRSGPAAIHHGWVCARRHR
ncbi:ROK family protein [Nocardia araoensis]|uniref:ROK family protein n=1 Tax=Nocardia araoensis TaxID=228600 RepID=UPI0012F6B8A3|nr:ROK family protein [Nocardia araoensis]